jgi:ribose 5-phosphate isomerase RpiB
MTAIRALLFRLAGLFDKQRGDRELAEELVETWLTTEFEGGRHQDRLDKIDA